MHEEDKGGESLHLVRNPAAPIAHPSIITLEWQVGNVLGFTVAEELFESFVEKMDQIIYSFLS
eukprot:m.226041 g.226041  ORF g.226041 m.226041 type:complete len:63 (+) comp26397_c0_seq3:496-684(+)